MRKLNWPASTQWVSWGVTALLVITAVLPVLPEGTPAWVNHAMVIAATILAVLTTRAGDKPRIDPPSPPTPPEAP